MLFGCRRENGGENTHSQLVSLKLQPNIRGRDQQNNRIRPILSTLSWQKLHKPVLWREEVNGPVFP